MLDAPPPEAFERLTRLATSMLRAPRSLVSLVAADRQFLVSEIGVGAREAPISWSYCRHVVEADAELVTSDAGRHPLLADSPLVAGGNVAYAGVPLRTSAGHVLGTLCVVDTEPREWTPEELAVLRDLAAIAMTELELRETNRALTAQIEVLHAAAEGSPDDALEQLLRSVTRKIPTACGAILLVGPDGGLEVGVAPDMPGAYRRAVERAGSGLPADPSVIAVARAHDELLAAACGVGIDRGWAAPLHAADGSLLGLLAVYRLDGADLTPLDIDAVRASLPLAAVVAERRRASARLHDPGSGLPSADLLDDRLARAVARQRRQPVTCGVLVVALAPGAADAEVAMVGGEIARAVRPGDTVARTAPDELTIVCEDVADTEALQGLAARLVGDLALLGAGGALSRGPDESPGDLLRRAREAALEATGCAVRRVVVHGAPGIPAAVLRDA